MEQKQSKYYSKENLDRIKKNISTSYIYFEQNYKRFHEFRRYIYETTIDDNKRAALAALNKPRIEFNILEAYINRQLGEFYQHEPSIDVSPSEGIPIDFHVLETIEGYLRHKIYEANKDSFSYRIFQDGLSGGFSVMKIWTQYMNAMSMKQDIRLGNVFDPTLCGFDPLARKPHKGDGNYSFEMFPMDNDTFKREYPKVDLTNVKYNKDIDGFSWSYKNNLDEKFVLVCEYFEKKKLRRQIVEIADGTVMLLKKYKKMLETWNDIKQPPIIVGAPRWTIIEVVCRYTLMETEIIDYAETDFCYLPHIFVDGNSVVLNSTNMDTTYQLTRPYVYQARGVQDLKNFAGQSLANGLKNMIQHKWVVKKEALPEEQKYLDALNNIQQASTVIVNAYMDNNPEQAIPEPIREINIIPLPPEVMGTFSSADPTTQTILGSFASNLGRNDNDLSGKAVIESATVGNATAMPYMQGYLQALTHAMNVIVDLIPKYIVGKRSIPVMGLDGETEYRNINYGNNPHLIYNEGALKVNIEPNVSFQTQKNQALAQIIALMGVSTEFAAFINSEKGLPILLQNLTIYGAEQLQQIVPQWIEQQQQQQAQQAQQQQQMMMQSPQMLEAQASQVRAQATMIKTQSDKEEADAKIDIDIARLGIDQQRVENETIETMQKVQDAGLEAQMTSQRAEAEIVSHALDAASKIAAHHHQTAMAERKEDREDLKVTHDILKGVKDAKVQSEPE